MSLEAFGSIGDFVGGLGVIASLIYLALQIRQNTRAVRSSSYPQAAEQTWNYCLAVAQDKELAEISVRRLSGETLTEVETVRVNLADAALLYGFENMLRLREEDLIDRDVWRNVIINSMEFLDSPHGRALLTQRPGPLSKRLLATIDEFARELRRDADAAAR